MISTHRSAARALLALLFAAAGPAVPQLDGDAYQSGATPVQAAVNSAPAPAAAACREAGEASQGRVPAAADAFSVVPVGATLAERHDDTRRCPRRGLSAPARVSAPLAARARTQAILHADHLAVLRVAQRDACSTWATPPPVS